MIQRRNYGRGHGYTIDGVKADGVTTLIGAGMPKPALTSWAARVTAEYAADNFDAIAALRELPDNGRTEIVDLLSRVHINNRNKAAIRGTEVHGYAETLSRAVSVDVPEALAGHVEACARFLDEWKVDPKVTECVIANRAHNYAGTLDVIADVTPPGTMDTVRAIVDYKTGASGIFPEVAWQLAAYRFAEVYLLDGVERAMHELAVTAGYAVWLRSDGYDVIEVRCGYEEFASFVAIATVARIAREKDNLVGVAA